MKTSTTEQEVLKEAENQGVSLTKRQSSAIAELVDADLEASGGTMSRKERIGMYVVIGSGVALLGAAGIGAAVHYNKKSKNGKSQSNSAPTPLVPQTSAPLVPEPTPISQTPVVDASSTAASKQKPVAAYTNYGLEGYGVGEDIQWHIPGQGT